MVRKSLDYHFIPKREYPFNPDNWIVINSYDDIKIQQPDYDADIDVRAVEK